MPFAPRRFLALAAFSSPLLAATAAHAQTVMLAMPTPLRLIGTQDVTANERPINLNPTGVNYADCLQDMQLQFPLVLSGFVGQSLQIWASATGSCQMDFNRGKMGTPPTCWQLNGGAVAINQPTTYSTSVNVRVQDLVGPQQVVPTTGTPVNWGVSACQNQPSFAAVPITLSFVPVNSAGIASGMGVDVTVNTDLVGPPPPTGIMETVGSMLFNVTWTPHTDTDRAGYDVYIAKNGAGSDAAAPDATAPLDASQFNVLVCDDAGTAGSSSSSGGTSDDSSDDAASIDATVADGASGGAQAMGSGSTPPNCHYVVQNAPASGSLSNGGSCMNTVLTAGFVTEGGMTITVSDDAGDDGGTTTESTGGGGISEIPTSYLVAANGTTTLTVSAESVSNYTIGGLTNGTTYSVVVSAVDGYGNIGPPSAEVCDFPAPVSDFFQTYAMDGGKAGGGFCALDNAGAPQGLSVVSLGFGALAFGMIRRRRSRSLG